MAKKFEKEKKDVKKEKVDVKAKKLTKKFIEKPTSEKEEKKTDKESKKLAVILTGGKQYLVSEKEEIVVDKLEGKEKEKLLLETLAIFDKRGESLELGTPALPKKTEAEIVSHLKGEKIRVAKFKAKVRYRKVKGFRAQLTKLKIIKIG